MYTVNLVICCQMYVSLYFFPKTWHSVQMDMPARCASRSCAQRRAVSPEVFRFITYHVNKYSCSIVLIKYHVKTTVATYECFLFNLVDPVQQIAEQKVHFYYAVHIDCNERVVLDPTAAQGHRV